MTIQRQSESRIKKSDFGAKNPLRQSLILKKCNGVDFETKKYIALYFDFEIFRHVRF